MNDTCYASGTSSLKAMVTATPVMSPVASEVMRLTVTGCHQKCLARCSWAPCLATTRHPPGRGSS